MGILLRRILGFGASSRHALGGVEISEGQLSTDFVELCFDCKDGGIEGTRGQSCKCEGFQHWHKHSPVKTALAASKVLTNPQHKPDIQALKYLLNE